MNNIVQAIVTQTGLPEDTVRSVVTAAMAHLKEKLPAPISAALDSYLVDHNDASADIMNQVTDGIGSLFKGT
ncbi:MAG: hypothetical protein H7338_15665 [Candidatus Sericytochromatia bacterium]|nr:hypothetical protein [Candidatus Sericytochromatia bacterium]